MERGHRLRPGVYTVSRLNVCFKTVCTIYVDIFHCSSLQSDRCHWGDPQSDHRAAVPSRSVSCWVWHQSLLDESGQHAVPWSSWGEYAPSAHLHLDYIRPHTFFSVLTQPLGEEITQVRLTSHQSLYSVENRAVCVLVTAADRQSKSCNIHWYRNIYIYKVQHQRQGANIIFYTSIWDVPSPPDCRENQQRQRQNKSIN